MFLLTRIFIFIRFFAVFSASTWKPPPLTKQGSGTSIYQPPGATTTNRTQPARYGGVHNRTNWSVK